MDNVDSSTCSPVVVFLDLLGQIVQFTKVGKKRARAKFRRTWYVPKSLHRAGVSQGSPILTVLRSELYEMVHLIQEISFKSKC